MIVQIFILASPRANEMKWKNREKKAQQLSGKHSVHGLVCSRIYILNINY